jgi:hypothetical protein
MKKLYFLSGLPRSGSTVLAALLNQHPEIYATSTSGLTDLLSGVLNAWSSSESIKSSIKNEEEKHSEIKEIVKNLCFSKYKFVEKNIIIDKSRTWVIPIFIDAMKDVLDHEVKIIATVRNVEDCVSSMVRIAKPENVDEFLKKSELIKHVKASYQFLAAGHEHAKDLIHYVDYDDLLSNPKLELQKIQNFLGISYFEYDINNIDGSLVKENDEEVWGIKNLHTIGSCLKKQHFQSSKEVLGSRYEQFVQPRFWLGEDKSRIKDHPLDIMIKEGLNGNFLQSEEIGKDFLKKDPSNCRAAFNVGWYILRNGNLLDGHKHLFRGREEGVFGNDFPRARAPMWDGVSRGTVLLKLEGGLGDEIHGAGMVRYIAKKGCEVILGCSEELFLIFKNILNVKSIVRHDAAFGIMHDFWVPAMSAVIPLGLQYENVDGSPYISRPKVIRGKRTRIGLRWQGNPKFEHEQHRLFPSDLFFEAVRGFDADFVSLQRDEGAQHRPDWVSETSLDTWTETQYAIASCDLVITSCTSVAHLSAAMGVETWIVIPVLPYYLWAKPGSKTEWYDSVTLFRQEKYGDWSAPFAAINDQLKARLGAKNGDSKNRILGSGGEWPGSSVLGLQASTG